MHSEKKKKMFGILKDHLFHTWMQILVKEEIKTRIFTHHMGTYPTKFNFHIYFISI